MLILVNVMDGVVGRTDDPTAEPVMGKAHWELFQAKVIDNSPNGHRCQHSQNGAEMERDEADNRYKKHGMGQGFNGIESK